MNKRGKTSFVKKDKIAEQLRMIVISLATGMLGFAISWIFDGHIYLSWIVFSIMAIVALIGWIVSTVYEKNVSILGILNDDIRHEKYQEAVKLGYSVSRALFLSGKHLERYRISEKVCQALDKLEGNIIVNEKTESVMFLKAKMLIDDCGWSLYLLNRFGNRKAAESRVKEGINQCLRLSALPDESAKTYAVVFKGIRHLIGMAIENFDEIPRNTLHENPELLKDYITSIYSYGGLMGYLLDDPRMIEEDYTGMHVECFSEVSMNAINARTYLEGFKQWCDKKGQDKKFLLSTYSFRAKYFLALIRIDAIHSNLPPSPEYLAYAKEFAVKMTLGYAPSYAEYEWLGQTLSFADEIREYHEDACISPDADRFVKGYVLLGTVAMVSEDLQSLEDAKTAFTKGASESKKVNRTDTYMSAQRKLISVNEKIYRLKANSNYYDEIDNQEALQHLMDSMEDILHECKQYSGSADDKMEKSCSERRKEYRRMMKEQRHQGK